MIGIGIAFILGILIGAYIANPILRKKINNWLFKRETVNVKTSLCKACKGTGYLISQSSARIKCSVCDGKGI